MPRCPDCGERIARNSTHCVHCQSGKMWPAEPGEDWPSPLHPSQDNPAVAADLDVDESESDGEMTPIARFSSAAEAGYFAHELRDGDGTSTRLTLEEQFDAIGGHWAVRYVLAVPSPEAEQAAARLSELVHQSAGGEFNESAPGGFAGDSSSPQTHNLDSLDSLESEGEYLTETGPTSSSGVNWVPIVLTLAAGSVALWAARRVAEVPAAPRQGPPPGGQQIGLWDYLDQNSGVWVQRMENQVGWREMRFDRLHRQVVIREDEDGDGIFETEIPLPADGLN